MLLFQAAFAVLNIVIAAAIIVTAWRLARRSSFFYFAVLVGVVWLAIYTIIATTPDLIAPPNLMAYFIRPAVFLTLGVFLSTLAILERLSK